MTSTLCLWLAYQHTIALWMARLLVLKLITKFLGRLRCLHLLWFPKSLAWYLPFVWSTLRLLLTSLHKIPKWNKRLWKMPFPSGHFSKTENCLLWRWALFVCFGDQTKYTLLHSLQSVVGWRSTKLFTWNALHFSNSSTPTPLLQHSHTLLR